jgi:hypothetical protein
MDALIEELMGLIETGADDPRLRWSPDRMTVQLVLSRLILDAAMQQDASGRRAGLGQAWQAAMTERGWVPSGQRGVFTARRPRADPAAHTGIRRETPPPTARCAPRSAHCGAAV